jgi:hypothetical protein
MPAQQHNELAGYTLLALANIGPNDAWSSASAVRRSIHGVIQFAASEYGKAYAENTRESIRRQAVHQFVQGGILARNPDDPTLPTNSGRTHYALTAEALRVVRSYGTRAWTTKVAAFLVAVGGGLADRHAGARNLARVAVTLPSGVALALSPGKHNELQIVDGLADLTVVHHGVQVQGDAPEGGALWAAGSAISANNTIIFDSEHAVHLSGGATFDGVNTFFQSNQYDTVTLEDAGTSFSLGSLFDACAALGNNQPGSRDPDDNEYCAMFRQNFGGVVLSADSGTSVTLDRVAVRQNIGVSGRPVALDLASGATGLISTSLFLENLVDAPQVAEAVASIAGGATADLTFTTLGDDFLPFRFETGAAGSVNASVLWALSGAGGGDPLVLASPGAIAGSCVVGAWNGTFGAGPIGNVMTDPVYDDPANLILRLDPVLSPAHDICFDPTMTDLNGQMRSVPAGGTNAEPGAFEIQ